MPATFTFNDRLLFDNLRKDDFSKIIISVKTLNMGVKFDNTQFSAKKKIFIEMKGL